MDNNGSSSRNHLRQMMRILLILTILAIFAISIGIVPVRAQDGATPVPTLRPVTDNEVNEISRGLYCPICQNVPLEVCTTTACARWREQVRDLLAQGYNEQQIRAYFVEHFGPQTVGVPTNPLAQALTLGLPLALIALVGVGITYTLIRWRKWRLDPANEVGVVITNKQTNGDDEMDEYRARLEAELKERE